MGKVYTVIGLMSGTSLDGIDAAILKTDGEAHLERGPVQSTPYSDDIRQLLRQALAAAASWPADAETPAAVRLAEEALTHAHVATVEEVLRANSLTAGDIDLLGFHGQTVLHRPEARRTVQIGDGALLARETGIDTVCDFRSADVAVGGEGAPLAPLYHAALVANLPAHLREGPVAVLNLGGVGNVTWINTNGDILAFDTGPANAPLNDWIERHTGGAFDRDGAIAARGQVDEARIEAALRHPYFARRPPKSLDRDDFTAALADGMGIEDGAATLLAFSAAAVAKGCAHLPVPPVLWIASGGGRRNPVLMSMLAERLDAPVVPAEAVGWRGDDIEAEAFAYLAVRAVRGLPLSLPGTTGVPEPMTGGRVFRAAWAD